MFDSDRWAEILHAIGNNKLRTFLSGFTVALGIFIFVILFGLGNGLKNSFQENFENEATNLIFIVPGRTSKPYKGYRSNRVIKFKTDDFYEVSERFASSLVYSSPIISKRLQTKYKGKANRYAVEGITPAYQFSSKVIIREGRFIHTMDVENRVKAAVIGRMVKKDLFSNEAALGKYFQLRGSTFKVVGVFTDSGGDDEERKIYIPYTTRQLLDKDNKDIDRIIVAFKPEIGYKGAMALQKQIRHFLYLKHNIHPEDYSGISFRNIADDIKKNQSFANILQMIVSFIGIGTLIAGVIGISNIMIYTVKERTKELGIRKALGATPNSVIILVLQESILITTIAGYTGLLFGSFCLQQIGLKLENYFIKNPYIDFSTGLYTTLVLIFFGIVAGYLPAKRAASIRPIVALRDE